MDLWSSSIDVLFLLLTLFLIPSISRSTPQLSITPPDNLSSPPATPFSPLTPITPDAAADSHLNVPGLVVPSIILTSSDDGSMTRRRSSFGSLRGKFGSHKRKTVSFSLSSIDDVLFPRASPNKHRPPTPFMRRPKSPSPSVESMASQPATPAQDIPGVTGEMPMESMRHGSDAEDPMGIRKKWLMV